MIMEVKFTYSSVFRLDIFLIVPFFKSHCSLLWKGFGFASLESWSQGGVGWPGDVVVLWFFSWILWEPQKGCNKKNELQDFAIQKFCVGGNMDWNLDDSPRHFLASSLPNQRNLWGIWIYLCLWRYLYLFIHLSGQIIATKPPMSSFFCWFSKGNPPKIPEQINPGFGIIS